jgi:glycosyltransferase involved in cell wall biosynthesis
MRLLFAGPFAYLPDNTSGREVSTHALALRLQARGIGVAVFAGISGAAKPQPGRPLLGRDDALGYPVYSAREPLLAYGDALAEWRPDIAILPYAEPAMPLVALGLHARVKAVLHVTNVDSRTADINLIEHPDMRLTACSPFAARRLEALQGVTAPVTLPLVEPDLYRVAGTGDAVLMVNPTLLKGVETFFRLAEARPHIPFVAVESWDIDDGWRLILANRARALGNVALWPSTADMRTAYAHARVVLMPSIHEETYGRIVAEAQLSGIPALASDRGALPDTVGAGGITLSADAGIAAWCAALDRIWAPDAHRGYAAAARRESERPDRRPESIVESFVGVLEAFAAGRNTVS